MPNRVVIVPQADGSLISSADSVTGTSNVVIITNGEIGPQGLPGLINRGRYNSTLTYGRGDVVYRGGSSWAAVTSIAIGDAPPATWHDALNPHWQLLVRGDDVTITVAQTAPLNPEVNDVWIVLPA